MHIDQHVFGAVAGGTGLTSDQWTAHALGMKHYGVRHNTWHTAPETPDVDYPEGFQGNEITVDGKTVANLVEDRLAGRV